MPHLTLRLFGAPLLELDERPLDTDRRKAVALLAYLALEGAGHSRESLATFFWPDADSSKSLAYLRRTLWELNQLLGEGWLDAGRENVQLAQVPWVDVLEFERLISTGGVEKGASSRAACLAEAADLYRGDFMAGFSLRDSPAFDEWQQARSEGLRLRLNSALAELAEACAAGNEIETAISYARRRLGLDNLDESAHRQLMLFYAGAGQKSAALRQYDFCKRILSEELGAAPEPETTHLMEMIRSGQAARFSAAARPPIESEPGEERVTAEPSPAALAPLPAPVHLPFQPTPFIGRQHELLEIENLLADDACRLLTLVGPGGIGKTRLSIQAASLQASRTDADGKTIFANGIYFIPLVSLDQPDQLAGRIAAELGVAFSASERTPTNERLHLKEFLREKKMLLVLDNFEQLIEGAELFSTLLAAAPQIKLLVTSRLRLNLPEEWALEIRGMDFPDKDPVQGLDQYPAVQLFMQNARRINPGLRFNQSDMNAVSEICRLVEGMPLGIELAASWLRTLNCVEIAAEIRRGLDFLTTTQRGIPERHRSLRAAFEQSWRLLSEVQRGVYRRCSIFRGGFQREAAAQVAGASLDRLAALLDASLIRRRIDGRFDLHEALRQFAAEKLDGSPQEKARLLESYSDYYLGFIVELIPLLKGGDQVKALDLIDSELQNIHEAWNWAFTHQAFQLARQAVAAVMLYIHMRSRFSESLEMVNFAVEEMKKYNQSHPGDVEADLILAGLMGLKASIDDNLGLADDPLPFHREVLQLASSLPHSEERAYALLNIGFGLAIQSVEESRQYYDECIQDFLAAGNEHGASLAELVWADSRMWHDERERLEHLQVCLKKLEALNDHWGAAVCLVSLGGWASWSGSYAEARQFFTRALHLYEELGDAWRMINARFSLGLVDVSTGDYAQALSYFQENVKFLEAMGRRHHLGSHYDTIGYIYYLRGKIDLAEEYYRRSLQMYEETNDSGGATMALANLGDVARSRGEQAKARDFYMHGLEILHPLPESNGVKWVRSICYKKLGKLQIELGELVSAEESLRMAIEIGGEILNRPELLDALVGFAHLHLKNGSLEKVVEVLAVVMDHSASPQFVKGEAQQLFSEIDLPPEAIEDARRRGLELGVDRILKSYLNP